MHVAATSISLDVDRNKSQVVLKEVTTGLDEASQRTLWRLQWHLQWHHKGLIARMTYFSENNEASISSKCWTLVISRKSG